MAGEIPAEQADMSWFRKAREDNYSQVNDLIRQASSEAGQAEQQSGKRPRITYAP